MKQQFSTPNEPIKNHINETNVVSQNGTVVSVEEKAFRQIAELFQIHSFTEDWVSVVEEHILRKRISVPYLKYKIESLLLSEQSELAYHLVSHVTALLPFDTGLDKLLFEAARANGNYAEALSCLEKWKSYASLEQSIHIYNEEAAIHKLMNDADNNFQCLKNVLHIDPNNETALQEIWWSIEMTKNYRESIKLHKEILQVNPNCYRAWYNLAHSQYYLFQYNNAIESFQKSIEFEPSFELAYKYCAEVCILIKEYKMALECYYDYLEKFQPDADGLKNIGQIYYQMKNQIKSRKYFLMARNLEPMDDEIYYLLGLSYVADETWNLAANYFERAISLNDRNEEYFIALAKTYASQGEHKRAQLFFRRATEIGPEIPEAWIAAADYHYQLADHDAVLELLEEAEDYTTGPEIYYMKSVAHFAKNEEYEAMEALGEGLQLDFDMHPFIFNYHPQLRSDKKVKGIIRYYEFD